MVVQLSNYILSQLTKMAFENATMGRFRSPEIRIALMRAKEWRRSANVEGV